MPIEFDRESLTFFTGEQNTLSGLLPAVPAGTIPNVVMLADTTDQRFAIVSGTRVVAFDLVDGQVGDVHDVPGEEGLRLVDEVGFQVHPDEVQRVARILIPGFIADPVLAAATMYPSGGRRAPLPMRPDEQGLVARFGVMPDAVLEVRFDAIGLIASHQWFTGRRALAQYVEAQAAIAWAAPDFPGGIRDARDENEARLFIAMQSAEIVDTCVVPGGWVVSCRTPTESFVFRFRFTSGTAAGRLLEPTQLVTFARSTRDTLAAARAGEGDPARLESDRLAAVAAASYLLTLIPPDADSVPSELVRSRVGQFLLAKRPENFSKAGIGEVLTELQNLRPRSRGGGVTASADSRPVSAASAVATPLSDTPAVPAKAPRAAASDSAPSTSHGLTIQPVLAAKFLESAAIFVASVVAMLGLAIVAMMITQSLGWGLFVMCVVMAVVFPVGLRLLKRRVARRSAAADPVTLYGGVLTMPDGTSIKLAAATVTTGFTVSSFTNFGSTPRIRSVSYATTLRMSDADVAITLWSGEATHRKLLIEQGFLLAEGDHPAAKIEGLTMRVTLHDLLTVRQVLAKAAERR